MELNPTLAIDQKETFILNDRPLYRKLQGLLGFRLLLAVFFLTLTLAVQSRRQESLLAAHLQPLYLFSCILFLFTIVAALSLRTVRHPGRFIYGQLFFDVGAVTFLIFISGGVESFFSFLYMPVIISAAVLLYRRGSLLIASLCSLAYGLLIDLQYFGWIEPLQIVAEKVALQNTGIYFHNILMNFAGFYLVAYLSGHLAEELQRSSQQINDQKRDFKQLEALHRNIVQSMSSGLLTISATGDILFANHAAQAMLALEVDDLEGLPFQKVFPEIDPLLWPAEAPRAQPGKSRVLNRREVAYPRPSGERLCLGYTVSALQTGSEAMAGWVFIFQDLTHLKAMSDHVQRMERLAFAGKIAAEIAHEIKNPLASISGAVQMLQDDIAQDSVESRLMNIVHREIHRINELVTDFLWLAKGSRKPERIEPIAVCSIVREVLALLKSQEKIDGCHRVKAELDADPILLMDARYFHQILWNLVVNALEAMPEGGDLMVRVSLSDEGPWEGESVRIDVQDTGEGISQEARSRIFEPFFTTKETGTGLGLSIVYQLVESAGGHVELQSLPSVGSTFSLFFPFSPSFPLAN